jgi:WD40 repeat protein
VSFTYEDDVLERRSSSDRDAEPNQRNIGVSVPQGPVMVNRNHPRNNDGEYFSVVVSHTVANPKPGSDEISRAFEESWIGRDGYLRKDGTRQKRALAFQGLVTASNGSQHAEVFVLDLPEDLTRAGSEPLEGSDLRRPAPPFGVVQRRLTFTENKPFPGIQGPRHWLRNSPDGSKIAFLMKDDSGIPQVWLISPNGGKPSQLTHNPWGVDSGLSWSPDGQFLSYVMDQSIFMTEVSTGRSFRLTKGRPDSSVAPQAYACVFSPDGKQIAFSRCLSAGDGSYSQIFVVQVPSIN